MTRHETEAELSDVQAQIARLQIRELFLQTRLRRTEAPEVEEAAPRPGWPIARADQTSGRRISTSAPSRIAV
jgi:hypothetical protein